jgi:hypothetical protein
MASYNYVGPRKLTETKYTDNSTRHSQHIISPSLIRHSHMIGTTHMTHRPFVPSLVLRTVTDERECAHGERAEVESLHRVP